MPAEDSLTLSSTITSFTAFSCLAPLCTPTRGWEQSPEMGSLGMVSLWLGGQSPWLFEAAALLAQLLSHQQFSFLPTVAALKR